MRVKSDQSHLDPRGLNACGPLIRGYAWSRLRARRRRETSEFHSPISDTWLRAPYICLLAPGSLVNNLTQDQVTLYRLHWYWECDSSCYWPMAKHTWVAVTTTYSCFFCQPVPPVPMAHTWYLSEMSPHNRFLLMSNEKLFCRNAVLLQNLFCRNLRCFVVKSVLSRFTRFCVEKTLTNKYAFEEKDKYQVCPLPVVTIYCSTIQ